jgi:hypothetical protein
MRNTSILLVILLAVVSLLVASCEPNGTGLPSEARRQVLLLASQGATIASVQATIGGNEEQSAWCVVTESETGKERWIISRHSAEGEKDSYQLSVPDGAGAFQLRGCTNWDD